MSTPTWWRKAVEKTGQPFGIHVSRSSDYYLRKAVIAKLEAEISRLKALCIAEEMIKTARANKERTNSYKKCRCKL